MALILIVDDEILIADMLATLLQDAGHATLTAPHGRVALELMQMRRPDLVITDFMMPVMTGLELAQAVRADGETRDLPIILCTGAQGVVARQSPHLFDVVLDKPYDHGVLLCQVERLTRKASR